MQTIRPIQMEDAAGSARALLDNARGERGSVPNMLRIMAQSPSTLEAYLRFDRALNGGKLEAKLRHQIALAVAQANHCEYSLAQHAALAGMLGSTTDEIAASREGRANDRKTEAALRFARDLVNRGGEFSTWELRQAGYDDAEIVEIIAVTGLNLFENYLNLVARTELDFPAVNVRAA